MTRSSVALDFERLGIGQGRPDLADLRPPIAGTPAFVGQVTSSGASIALGHFLMVAPTSILGAEAEGGPGALGVASGASIPVYLIGPSVPSRGDFLICRFVDHRWVAERSSGGASGPPPISVPACFCPIPATLQMTSANTSCNYGMFQSCTIRYVATPSWAADLGLGSMIFMSDQSFTDAISNASFFYYLSCQFNQFNLTRIYPVSPYGSPYRDALLYSWLLGGYGNSCSPFHLDGGKPFPGSDQTCLVMIDPA